MLAVAYKMIDSVPETPTSDTLEQGLTLMGLVGMIDPPRPEAKEAVAVCRRAGIKPVMITGDHVVTASAIAKELGILQEGDEAITGAELDAMDDAELDKRVRASRFMRACRRRIKSVLFAHGRRRTRLYP